jgi:hypothetical protein
VGMTTSATLAFQPQHGTPPVVISAPAYAIQSTDVLRTFGGRPPGRAAIASSGTGASNDPVMQPNACRRRLPSDGPHFAIPSCVLFTRHRQHLQEVLCVENPMHAERSMFLVAVPLLLAALACSNTSVSVGNDDGLGGVRTDGTLACSYTGHGGSGGM